jgi:ParB family transcriptional regulator, chromosome partitioning protein
MAFDGRLGGPLDLPMDLIDEDPLQPRTVSNPGFSDQSLQELAASIRLRNVKTPISVRRNPDLPGRFIINHGARRFRASRLAGRTAIPGFIDDDYSRADQVVENLHRNELTAREIADYIGRELSRGIKKSEIARGISKSAAFVTQYVTLLDLPDPVARTFNSGRVRDVTVVNELVSAYKACPDEVAEWLADQAQEITRGTVRHLRQFLEQKVQRQDFVDASADEVDGENLVLSESPAVSAAMPASHAAFSGVLIVSHLGRLARLLAGRRPGRSGFAWLRYEDDETTAEVALKDILAVALVDRHQPVEMNKDSLQH